MSNNHTSLTEKTTFKINTQAKNIITITSSDSLIKAWQYALYQEEPVLILGEGSNVLFLEDFIGTVIINRIKGITVTEDNYSWKLHVGAGENWHDLVKYSLAHGIAGLENLALIFGCVGSAPIQNIGAYGIEFQKVCEYVDVLNLYTKKSFRLMAHECQFGYRTSIFMYRYKNGYAVIAVGLHLNKQWHPVLHYGDLAKLSHKYVTPKQVFNYVCHLRRLKLPNPKNTGNVGSFFKNPIVIPAVAEQIKFRYPKVPLYQQVSGNIKLAAGWLIDSCGLKGFQIGRAAVHNEQALVLINLDNATSHDVIKLARVVRNSVAQKFGVWLEPEVRFISSISEIDAIEALS
ncbi:UDP-N-acetylenolpyruvoylglucosamine reductase [Candidatus Profftia lariciata]|uniref:UDP-N-acetylmuramate dehydrogenase n=1 Tax=Candidatus Profftia lariciata TaxID=1987921 RepID=UPI001D01811C|nr:UDP-N-acetylmuramate dehydrogenase [Candidatus Profftia lariciata]UDG81302.1 UDP-N-acetylenolpyruvoylglucosamine reductase [Candidatus Profftia lariciata]